ncbi:MAG: hypothetical protein K0S09_2567 [Sphingobacteriaceae bacterium]|jgi:hypothetical protein|nr:hypothetical protein [Sphingobacteriaceae bacterium]
MKLKNIILLTGVLLPAFSYAQYAEDALRFSNTEQGTTSRFKALGGAQTALGGDISSAASNPAGLGLFTKSELNLTTGFLNRTQESHYINTSTSLGTDKLDINELGAVFHIPSYKSKGSDLTKGWLGFNFGLSYNKTNNFNTTIDFTGANPKSSFADYIADLATSGYLANGNPATNSSALPTGSLEKMGYRNYLIEYNSSGYFATPALNNMQENNDFRTGSQSEFNIGGGANYGNSIYLGASVGIANIDYTSDREFSESGKIRSFPGQDANFTGSSYALSYRSTQNTTGAGLNLKFGAIARLDENVRVGLSFISPTWYSINDRFSETLDTRYTRANGTTIAPYTNDEEIYDSKYSLRTPYKVNGGIAFTFGGMGLISGDVEYVDYASMHFSSDSKSSTDNTNRNIRNNYKNAVNFKLGGEYKINNIAVRAGYNESGNPYQKQEYSSRVISGGIGYRKNVMYLDVTYANSQTNYSSAPYTISDTYPDYPTTGSGFAADIKDTRNNVFVTLGVRF